MIYVMREYFHHMQHDLLKTKIRWRKILILKCFVWLFHEYIYFLKCILLICVFYFSERSWFSSPILHIPKNKKKERQYLPPHMYMYYRYIPKASQALEWQWRKEGFYWACTGFWLLMILEFRIWLRFCSLWN